MEKQDVFFGSALLSIVIATWMLWPYADAILWAVFTAYFLHYIADYLNSYIHNKHVTTGLMMLLVLGVVTGIFTVIISGAQAQHVGMAERMILDSVNNGIEQFGATFGLSGDRVNEMKVTIHELTMITGDRIIYMMSEIPVILLNLLIYLVISLFLVRDGPQFAQQLFDAVRNLPEDYRDVGFSVIKSVDNLFKGVFVTEFAVAFLVGMFAMMGYYILGVQLWWAWGLLILIMEFLPIITALLVYIPLSAIYVTQEGYVIGLSILVYSVVMLNILPDIVFRPYLAAHQTHEHPLLLFVGFVIGTLTLGLKGLILGPVILVVTKNLLTMKYFDTHPAEPIPQEA